MGRVADSQGEYAKAMQLYEESLAITVKVYGTREHASVATTLDNMGQPFYGMGGGPLGGTGKADDHEQTGTGQSLTQRDRHSLGGTIGPTQPRPQTTTPLTMNQLLLRGAVLRSKNSSGHTSRKLNTFVLWAFVINTAILASSVALELVTYTGLERQETAQEAGGEMVDYAVECTLVRRIDRFWRSWPVSTSFAERADNGVFVLWDLHGRHPDLAVCFDGGGAACAGTVHVLGHADGSHSTENDWNPAAKPAKYKIKPSNTGLNEDLGSVEYIFSDKTRTLTRNEMKMVQWWFGGRVHGEIKTRRDGELMMCAGRRNAAWIKVQATELRLAPGLYHSVIPSLEERTGKYVYESQSPDKRCRGKQVPTHHAQREHRELALTPRTATSRSFVRRVSGGKGGSLNPPQTGIGDCTDRILFYCKGAYNIILEGLGKDHAVNPPANIEATNEALERFSTEGYECDDYIVFREALDEAERSLEDREGRIDAVCAAVERELQLVGATAIEHKLQNEETAINIGMSSKLIMGDMKVLILDRGSVGETVERVEQMLAEVDRGSNVINGPSLGHVFSTSTLLKDTSGHRSVFSQLTGKGKTTPTTTLSQHSVGGVPSVYSSTSFPDNGPLLRAPPHASFTHPPLYPSYSPTPLSSKPLNPQQLLSAAFNQGYYSHFFIEQRKLGRGHRGSVFLYQHILDHIVLGERAIKQCGGG
ncbi:hypothetical protein BJ742DRAFT_766314 [Cladochytrium replicatum]|nr:hypothetical protein BJ742DRAFT_766314 [Cladochytrium replicatum]